MVHHESGAWKNNGWVGGFIYYIVFLHPKIFCKMIQHLTFTFFSDGFGVFSTTKLAMFSTSWQYWKWCFFWYSLSHEDIRISFKLIPLSTRCWWLRYKSRAHWVPKVSKILGTTYSHCDWSPRMLNIFRSLGWTKVVGFRSRIGMFFFGGWKNESGKEIDGKSILKWFEALKFLSLFPKSLKLVLLESCWLSLIAEVDTTSSHFLPMLGLCVTATQIFCQCFEDSHSPSMEYFRYSNALV